LRKGELDVLVLFPVKLVRVSLEPGGGGGGGGEEGAAAGGDDGDSCVDGVVPEVGENDICGGGGTGGSVSATTSALTRCSLIGAATDALPVSGRLPLDSLAPAGWLALDSLELVLFNSVSGA
tara:strand:- start:400 stop:765 length:366 start_codon:yes stop_codon:yes gene_type:complete